MSLRLPCRCLSRPETGWHHLLRPLSPTISRRSRSTNPVLEDYLKRKPKAGKVSSTSAQVLPRRGDLAPSSIFEDELPPDVVKRRKAARDASEDDEAVDGTGQRNAESMAAKLDPQPSQRRRWERKMVIREIRKRGRLTKPQLIKRTERSKLAKSEFYKTSMKKLAPLARQIAGKSVEDALIQMRYSKKKMARRIHAHLLEAKDAAVVERGMGLGQANGTMGTPVMIELKDGSRRMVKDRTALYIEQAWVGKGSYGRDTYKRARGKIDILKLPQTSISVVLKEEATRVREHEEREARRKNKKVWLQLPNRPVTTQRQYYCW